MAFFLMVAVIAFGVGVALADARKAVLVVGGFGVLVSAAYAAKSITEAGGVETWILQVVLIYGAVTIPAAWAGSRVRSRESGVRQPATNRWGD